ncbi:MAG: KpsF/GutQ family sugar-phosphate isomerase [Phycisphaerales bacterium]|nr:KpsF/GutQ family sugar-phosphate isomerase [Phycisphaerales bacterium]
MSNGQSTSTPLIPDKAFLADVLRAEADALQRLAESVQGDEADRWTQALDLIDNCPGHVVVSGMGKSGLVGAKISATLASVGVPSHVVHPADAVHGDLGRIRPGDIVLLLSFSGGTEEIVNLANILRADQVTCIGISRSHDSHLARLCDVHLALGDLDEAGNLALAPTTSTTATLACGDALALAVAHRRAFTEEDFQRRHPGGALGAQLRCISELLRFKVGENLTTCRSTDRVHDALVQAEAQQTSAGVRHAGALLVVDEQDQLRGIVTDGDLRRSALSDSSFLDRSIGEIMTADPIALKASDRVAQARAIVAEHRIDEIPVVDDAGKPVGLIDVQDLLAPSITAPSP